MKQKVIAVALVGVIVFVLDHLTKLWVVQAIPMGHHIPVIDGFFDLVHGRNTGAAFGFLSDWDSPLRNAFFYVVGVVAMVFLYFYVKTVDNRDKRSLLALGFILGGAWGNLIDRVMRGSVVDFLSVHIGNEVLRLDLFGFYLSVPLTWPAFNVADMAISAAVALLIIQGVKNARAKEKEEDVPVHHQ